MWLAVAATWTLFSIGSNGKRMPLTAGSKICVVEDTVTTGGSLLKAIGHIEDAGFEVVQCICVVDRREGGVERFASAGYTLEALVGREDLVG